MLGLGLLVALAITLALYVGWVKLIVKVFRRIGGSNALVPLKIIAAAFLLLLPFYQVLIYPLVANECAKYGREISYPNTTDLPRKLLFRGKYYTSSTPPPLSELSNTNAVDTFYFDKNSDYGEAFDIRSRAEIHEDPFGLSASNVEDIACGPHLALISQSKIGSTMPGNKCLAIFKDRIEGDLVEVSTINRNERTWRTAYQAIKWHTTRFDLVHNGEVQALAEIREFKYEGAKFPPLLPLIPIGEYSCVSKQTVQSMLMSIFQPHGAPKGDAPLTPEQAQSQVAKLIAAYWGYALPKKAYSYEVAVYDHDNVSSVANPLHIALTVRGHDAAVLLRLMSNKAPEWVIHTDDPTQVVMVERRSLEGGSVKEIAPERIWDFDDLAIEADPLLRFYTRNIRTLEHEAMLEHRYCKVHERAQSRKININIGSCGKPL